MRSPFRYWLAMPGAFRSRRCRVVVSASLILLVYVSAAAVPANADFGRGRSYAGDGRFALGEVPHVSQGVDVAGLADGTVLATADDGLRRWSTDGRWELVAPGLSGAAVAATADGS